jgi:hypothetical protein
MKKTILPLIACFLVSLALLPVLKAGSRTAAPMAASIGSVSESTATTGGEEDAATASAAAASLYSSLQLKSLGLSFEALDYALKGHAQLVKTGAVSNKDVLTVIDFSQPSSKKRMYIIDVANAKVLYNTYVAHGKNTGLQYAEKFSNKNESLQSSLGFYVTKATYSGKHGLSLRLSGKEAGWNDNAEQRAVVVHGAEYIGSNRADAAYMGRSWGCPAVPQAQAATVINLIKDGTTLFIYHPSASYIKGSKLLNA